MGKAQWVKHLVIPGEKLNEIAERYAVSAADIRKWNKLSKRKLKLRSGTYLHIHTPLEAVQRKQISHVVQKDENWASIAKEYGVDEAHLRQRWNHKLRKRKLRPKDTLTIWKEVAKDENAASARPSDAEPVTSGDGPDIEGAISPATLLARKQQDQDGELSFSQEEEEAPLLAASYFPIMDVPLRSRSLGHPGSGKILHPVQLPRNESLYHLRDPNRSYVSSHTAMVLQNAIARFRLRTTYKGLILIKDLSRRGGGPLFPHKSHQSGRDADVQLLLKEGTTLYSASNVDWDANWALLHSLVESQRIKYIFLSWPQQRQLYRAARRAGMKRRELKPIIEFPNRHSPTIIRDEPGHDTHFHVRVDCAPWEGHCIE